LNLIKRGIKIIKDKVDAKIYLLKSKEIDSYLKTKVRKDAKKQSKKSLIKNSPNLR
jgi:hypothetical protein|tara:strand:+ start:1312 stop:1479 length:168 start_codon:yes stop_codon:yes gene_type:complete